jgi:hypothetical protein
MGLDIYQVTDAHWNGVHYNPLSDKMTEKSLVYPETFKTDTQVSVTQKLTKDFYSSTWFRALNDIRRSETFMKLLDDTYWTLKGDLIKQRGHNPLVVDPYYSEAVYKFDMGSIIPKSYFLEVRFNFNKDEIHLGIGQYT